MVALDVLVVEVGLILLADQFLLDVVDVVLGIGVSTLEMVGTKVEQSLAWEAAAGAGPRKRASRFDLLLGDVSTTTPSGLRQRKQARPASRCSSSCTDR